ncbi:hypothetical protein Val02_44560 [Virgisporangium aliadipatigenens]|uniref:DUF1501 domain-containing protein n=1 Tax=Virgisporangium aliadipatigenens TaxID=741659 RepID=A0A8J3YPC9_9ACTN|nr:DUF1501 domain-containing protein [Virgisporangium aliadipatigenens]GIJ47570.1 hypothetical protein Val02_44560 [Virgisporangium aliadipatigenens]
MSHEFLHPDCPDNVPNPRTREELLRYGPNEREAALRIHAEAVTSALAAQKESWRHGFTRRRVIAGAGAVGVAALGTQLVTTKVAFGAPADERTLVVVMLRGGMDFLSVVVPRNDGNYRAARPGIAVPDAALLDTGSETRFGLHPAMAPLHELWKSGSMAAVHAVASPDASRSHFQAQDCYERGAASTAVRTGWLDRVLGQMGEGTTFRAIAEGSSLPRSLVGTSNKLVLRGIQDFRLDSADNLREKSLAALKGLYTGLDHPLAAQAGATIDAIGAARKVADVRPNAAAQYPGGGFANGMRDVAKLIKAKVGLRVASVDLGGWDMHTNLGTVDGGDMRNNLTNLAATLGAFATDIGPDNLKNVTVVTMSEFGRRVQQNANAGTDHGHGGGMLLIGGGLNGGRVHGAWPGLAQGALDHGDLAGANDYRSVLFELVKTQFGVGDAKAVFPEFTPKRIGAFAGS